MNARRRSSGRPATASSSCISRCLRDGGPAVQADIAAVTRLGFAVNPTSESAVGLRERALGWCAVHGIEAWAAEASARDVLVRDLPTSDALVRMDD